MLVSSVVCINYIYIYIPLLNEMTNAFLNTFSSNLLVKCLWKLIFRVLTYLTEISAFFEALFQPNKSFESD